MARYIAADALKSFFKGLPEGLFDTDEVVEAIDMAPTVGAVPEVHACWQRDEDTGEEMVRCSNCREVYDCSVTPVEFAGFYRYCPCCGAKMDAEQQPGDE